MSDKAPKEKIQVEPVIKDQALFDFLTSLFFGTGDFPERIEVRIVTGPHKERLGPMIDQFPFKPEPIKTKGEKDGEEKKVRGVGKPSNEDLVELSNKILHIIKRDCDMQRKPTYYAALAWNHSRDESPYARCLFHRKPTGEFRNSEGDVEGIDEDEARPMKPEQAFAVQVLAHHERMIGLVAGSMENIVDRYDRDKVRDRDELASLREENRQLREERERLATNEEERRAKREWEAVKTRMVEKGIEMAAGLAPSILNQLAGKQIIATKESAESTVLKAFFQKESQGGKLTDLQAELAFGVFDDTPENNLVKPGVLSIEQAKLLYDVSQCTASPDRLDELLPNGPIAITTEQLVALQPIFSPEQFLPLVTLFRLRQSRHEVSK